MRQEQAVEIVLTRNPPIANSPNGRKLVELYADKLWKEGLRFKHGQVVTLERAVIQHIVKGQK